MLRNNLQQLERQAQEVEDAKKAARAAETKALASLNEADRWKAVATKHEPAAREAGRFKRENAALRKQVLGLKAALTAAAGEGEGDGDAEKRGAAETADAQEALRGAGSLRKQFRSQQQQQQQQPPSFSASSSQCEGPRNDPGVVACIQREKEMQEQWRQEQKAEQRVLQTFSRETAAVLIAGIDGQARKQQ